MQTQSKCCRWFFFLPDVYGFWEHAYNFAEKIQYNFHGQH